MSALPSAFRQGAFAVGSTRPKAIPFRDERVLVGSADLDVVNALDIGQAGPGAGIGQPAILAHGRGLEIGREIGERVVARIVVVLILPHKAAEREHAYWR